jgi:4,5-DOPA dioxygenase extradiol
MNRRTFLGVTLVALETLYANEAKPLKAPALFCAHGSPMNMITTNAYTKAMYNLAAKLQKPKAVVMVSAHWVTDGLFISTAKNQETIHDFYGFPKALYDMHYPAQGEQAIAAKIIDGLSDFYAKADTKRGLDHGGWSVMKFLFPKADVPVFQISLNKNFTPQEHFELGKRLAHLRDENIMIIGSGDIAHNLWELDRDPNAKTDDWAIEFEAKIKIALLKKDFNTLINYMDIGEVARLSCPTNEHYLPLLYVAAAAQQDELSFFYEGFEHATISLSSFGANL